MDVVKELLSKWQQRWPGLAGLDFSEWTHWKNRNTLNNLNRVGVYVLAKYEAKKVPDIVNPLDGKIVYIGKTNIGETTNLKKRLSYFNREAFGTGASHSGASTYKMLYGRVQDDLYVSIYPIFWSNEELNKLIVNRIQFNKWISKNQPEIEPFLIHLLVNWLEVFLRGTYVYKWGRLPICNKE